MKIFLMFITLFISLSGKAYSFEWKTIVQTYGPAVGKIEIRDGKETLGSGSGFVIDAEGRMITSAHVVQEPYFNTNLTIVVIFKYDAKKEKEEYIAKIEKFDSDGDIAIIKIPVQFKTYCILEQSNSVSLMSDVLVIGYPLGKNFKSTPGYLQAYQDVPNIGKMLDLSASIDPGNSGGPVFNSDGKIIGIVTAKIMNANFNLALPIKNAIDFMNSKNTLISVNFDSDPSGSRISIDGNYKGITPISIELYPRSYQINLEKDGYNALEKTITLQESEKKPEFSWSLTSSQTLKSKVTIETTPANAEVIVDNISKGTTPVQFEIEKGSKLRIKIKLKGYKEFYTEVFLKQDDAQVLTFNLTPKGS